MSQPYVGEIRLVGFNFPPQGWLLCDGQLLSIAENSVLFDLIGTTYGGDGVQTFGIPNLQGRVPMHVGSGYVMGELFGSESVTVTSQQLPSHNHSLEASGNLGTATNATNNVLAQAPLGLGDVYVPAVQHVNMNAASIGTSGSSQPHENRMPFLAMNYIISLFGVFPSQ